ncbi:MAG TPA: GNAT family N-acetyltransferase [Anaerolineae bacterium]|nr:GNAT family N-acetyltransferase [Anaerolineae bacterium]
MVRVRLMRTEDTFLAAAIHIEGQPHGFLTSLGQHFVARLFAYAIRSPHGFGFVAVEGKVIGFVVGTTNTARLYRDVLTRGFVPLAVALLGHVLRHPRVVRKLLETLRYPAMMQEQPGEAESISRGVRVDWRGKGVGSLLWKAVTGEARRRGATHIITTVDQAHDVVNAWHRARNHELVRTFVLHRRPMNVYRIPLEPDPGPTGEDFVPKVR